MTTMGQVWHNRHEKAVRQMDARITTVMVELRNKLKVLYGRRLKGVYLYGSHARGHASRESDLDVLIVLDEIPHYSLEVSRTSALISSLSLSLLWSHHQPGVRAGARVVARHDSLCGECAGRSDPCMNDESQALLAKAERAIRAANTLLRAGDPDFAVGRAYYGMFYVAEALLVEKELRFHKHGGVHAAFGEHIVKTGMLDEKFHRWLLDAFDQRIVGDYGVTAMLTSEDAALVIAHAEEFLSAATQHLKGLR